MTRPPTTDRRAAIKARHHRAILDAALELIEEDEGGARFTVDELAARADVSRRTIFNHFESVDDVVLTACTEVLDVVVAAFQREAAASTTGDGSRASMFDEIAHAVRATDLPEVVAYMWRALGGTSQPGPLGSGEQSPRQQRFMQVAMSRIAGDLTPEVLRRNPTADPLDAELLVAQLLHGVVVISTHWIATWQGATSAQARADWDRLLDRLITGMREGYRHAQSSGSGTTTASRTTASRTTATNPTAVNVASPDTTSTHTHNH